jgi:hypothetical protein
MSLLVSRLSRSSKFPDEFRLAMPGVLWKPALSAIGRLRRYPAVQRDAEPASVGAGWEAKAQS